jgi:D-tyrosyl-tRNA(Tyr) deacylase
MRSVVQRVSEASVTISGETVGRIGRGLLVLVGVEVGDSAADAEWLAGKISQMRIFADGDGKMNLSVREIDGGVLVISQFTLLADTRKGNRPSFVRAARPPFWAKEQGPEVLWLCMESIALAIFSGAPR